MFELPPRNQPTPPTPPQSTSTTLPTTSSTNPTMSKPPKPPNLPIVGTQTLSTTSVTTNLARTPSTTMTGVTVPPEVWAQMQQLLAAFAPLALTTPTITATGPLAPSTAPSIAGSDPLPSPAPLSSSFPPTTPSNRLTQSNSSSEFPGINDFASLLSPEIDEDHLPNEVAGSSDVENTNELANPALVHS
ncbi:hypothetical protein MJO29_002516 [Puccinia striiformis f. sp. tritici]|nr:hypothetical protein MJO29_002516 [Puccinia striiformis f. sp. tritici]